MAETVDQSIRFCRVDGHAVAFAVAGSGPPLLVPGAWIGHLELDWSLPGFQTFVSRLGERRTVIRYDRLGIGLSDRDVEPDTRLGGARELATITAILDHLGVESPVDLLGISAGAATAVALAAADHERVRSLVLFGAAADGAAVGPPELRDALVATVRAHWGAGSRALADVWLPGAATATREAFASLQRAAATPEMAAAGLAAFYATDLTDTLPVVRAPTLVLHRREDRAVPFAQGRALAAGLADARLVALAGAIHPPWLGDSASVLRETLTFLDPDASQPERPSAPDGLLSVREQEVLRLVAQGMNDGEIAERLVVSPHTVHRHMANIRAKLGQPSRAAAAAHAARHGMI